MKKSQLIHIGVVIVSIILSSLVASYLNKKKHKIMPYLDKITKTPLAGFHKFASDVEWMRFIQYAGSQEGVNKKNVAEHLKRIQEIVALDPNFEKAYTVGVNLMAIEDPKEAVRLLDQACHMKYLKKNWKIPFYAGFILSHFDKQANIDDVVKYYSMAVKRAGTPEHFLVNALIRAKVKQAMQKNSGMFVNKYHATLYILYREWKKNSGSDMGESGFEELNWNLTQRLLKAAQKAKAHANGNQKILDLIAKVKKDVLKGKHLCENCLCPYGPGDRYCSHCGHKVEVYGICPKCGAVLKGNYCSHCGYKVKK